MANCVAKAARRTVHGVTGMAGAGGSTLMAGAAEGEGAGAAAAGGMGGGGAGWSNSA